MDRAGRVGAMPRLPGSRAGELADGPRRLGARMRANWTDIAEGHFEASQDIEITSVLAPKKRPPNPSRFKFEKVNEVTWKLTNGEMTNVPAQIGFWGGYRVTKAIAWVIDVAPNAWLARRGIKPRTHSRYTRPSLRRWRWLRVRRGTTKSRTPSRT